MHNIDMFLKKNAKKMIPYYFFINFVLKKDMHIYNVEEHLACLCYSNVDKPQIEVLNNTQIATEEISLVFNEIVFVLKGTLRITMQHNFFLEAAGGRLVFLPANSKILCHASAGCTILILRIKDDIQLCHTFNLNRLKNHADKHEKTVNFETMEINARLKYFAKGLVDTYEDGLRCRYFFKAKITEALIMIRAYYSEKQLFRFFYYYFSPDAAFAEFVRTSYMNYTSVNEFADALSMTPQQFSRRFNIVFGEAPYRWMQREKAQLIYGELCRSNKPIKEIAEKYGFNIQSNFNRFCKTTFGLNPREIRKKRS